MRPAAFAAARRAVELDDRDIHAHLVLAAVLKARGDAKEALAQYDRALALDGKSAWVHLARGNFFKDEKQFALLTKFQGRVGEFVNDHLVNGEIATFRAKLKLDSSQEKKIRKLVEQRYQRVYERIKVPIPNVMMKGMRRRQDEDIYRETGDAIKAVLTPDQAAAFDRLEREQPQQIFAFRANLIPK